MLNVIEIFSSIQGEGPATGEPAIFIRLAGCSVKCKWCDTDYITGMKQMTEDFIVDKVEELGKGIVVITGGEPLIQDIFSLVRKLTLDSKREIHIETSGTTECFNTLFLPSTRMVVSPKTEFLSKVAMQATAWKYVVGHEMLISKDDGLPAGLAQPLNNAPIYIQPLWNNKPLWDSPMERNNALAIEIVKKYGYKLSLQIHKYLGIR